MDNVITREVLPGEAPRELEHLVELLKELRSICMRNGVHMLAVVMKPREENGPPIVGLAEAGNEGTRELMLTVLAEHVASLRQSGGEHV